ncbi:MAG: hypothetical protein KJI69_06420, partial [Patescibacteria group bacterium]|nr:hypothetical protein [Patescibacteria group bacterium]
MTLAIEGFDGYGNLSTLSINSPTDPIEITTNGTEFYFQSLESQDRRLVDSLGFWLNAYDFEEPQYLEGFVNLYKGLGTDIYGSNYQSREYAMNWDNEDYQLPTQYMSDFVTSDLGTYNENNFGLSDTPLTTDGVYIEGEVLMHHEFSRDETFTDGLPLEVFRAYTIPNETARISSVQVSDIIGISSPYSYVESWQGYTFTDPSASITYSPDNYLANPIIPSDALSSGEYTLFANENGSYEIYFLVDTQLTDFQVDFHISYEFTEGSDFIAYEQENTFGSNVDWIFPDNGESSWALFSYHPDLTADATFTAYFSNYTEYATAANFKSQHTENFTFCPFAYNFTEFTFDGTYTLETVDLEYGSEFSLGCDTTYVLPVGMNVQTVFGEKYLPADDYITTWTHTGGYSFTFYLNKDIMDYLGIIQDSEILLTYKVEEEEYSYYTTKDDLLKTSDWIIKDSNGDVILNSNISSVVGNNITLLNIVKDLTPIGLTAGEEFSITYEYRTRGGLLESKHIFYEVTPWTMQFYNKYYPIAGASIIAPLYYNMSSLYTYQLALNYRLKEKAFLSFQMKVDGTGNDPVFDLGKNIPEKDIDDTTDVIIAYYYDPASEVEPRVDIDETDIIYSDGELTLDIYDNGILRAQYHGIIPTETVIYIDIMPKSENLYQEFYDFTTNIIDGTIDITDWSLNESEAENLIANMDSPHIIFDGEPNENIWDGKVKQIYASINDTRSLTYSITEDLNNATYGWTGYRTLIMKTELLNSEVVEYITAEFWDSSKRGEVKIYPNETYGDVIYLDISGFSSSLDSFTRDNDARILFIPTFYEADDFKGDFYTNGMPYTQEVIWSEDGLVDGELAINLEKRMKSTSQTVVVLNALMEPIYEISIIGTHTETSSAGYDTEYDDVTLSEFYTDYNGNMIKLRTSDIIYLKFNSTLEKEVALLIENMVLVRDGYITDYATGDSDVPAAELSLLGIYSDGFNYTSVEDLQFNRDKLVGWTTPLDPTPFVSEFSNEYHQTVFNISFEDINNNFIVTDGDNNEYFYATDILFSSNDPRYELVVDSAFIFEFEENATLYDSGVFDIFPMNNMTSFYFGNYSDIFDEWRMLDTTGSFPMYNENITINETIYFKAFDLHGNEFYFGEDSEGQLIGFKEDAGQYNLTWNELYSDEFYWVAQDTTNDIEDLIDSYNPYPHQFNYLYVQWASNTSWNEWHTIERPNINETTVEVMYEFYNSTTEEYETINYNQTLDEFGVRHIAEEYIYPYNTGADNGNFDLSQDYSNAQDVGIIKVTGLYYNGTTEEFDSADYDFGSGGSDKTTVDLANPNNGQSLAIYEQIIVFINFSSGALSDYSQFRMLQAAIDNYSNANWTINESLWVEYEYTDLDYFILFEDYYVGSEDSLFESIPYIRNEYFVDFDDVMETYEILPFNQ